MKKGCTVKDRIHFGAGVADGTADVVCQKSCIGCLQPFAGVWRSVWSLVLSRSEFVIYREETGVSAHVDTIGHHARQREIGRTAQTDMPDIYTDGHRNASFVAVVGYAAAV